MIRRTVLTASAVLALTLAPAAAQAYDAPGFETTVADPTPATGAPVTVSVRGAGAGAPVTLTVTSEPASLSNDSIQIAGTKSLTKPAGSTGVATFAVTFVAGGTYNAVATDAAGRTLGTEVLTVAAPAAPGAAATGGAATGGAAAGAALSETGFDATGLAVGAGAMVLAGAGAVVVARRRQTSVAGH